MSQGILISTKHYDIRDIVDADINNVFKGLSHPDVIKYYGVSFETLAATKEQMDWFKKLEQEKTGKWWVISSRATGEFIGAGGYNDWDHKNKKAEIGYWLLPEFWGKGIMKETFPRIVDYGHKEMKLRRIEGYVQPNNVNCKRVLEKVDFQYEGTLRECEFKDGGFISWEIYSSIRSNSKAKISE